MGERVSWSTVSFIDQMRSRMIHRAEVFWRRLKNNKFHESRETLTRLTGFRSEISESVKKNKNTNFINLVSPCLFTRNRQHNLIATAHIELCRKYLDCYSHFISTVKCWERDYDSQWKTRHVQQQPVSSRSACVFVCVWASMKNLIKLYIASRWIHSFNLSTWLHFDLENCQWNVLGRGRNWPWTCGQVKSIEWLLGAMCCDDFASQNTADESHWNIITWVHKSAWFYAFLWLFVLLLISFALSYNKWANRKVLISWNENLLNCLRKAFLN